MIHWLYGLKIATNKSVPNLIAQPDTASADLHVWFDLLPFCFDELQITAELWYTSNSHNEQGQPSLVIFKLNRGSYFWLIYADGTQFIINLPGSQVWATQPKSSTFEDTVTYFLGPIMGFVLMLRGTVSLHASAVVAGSQIIAILGPAGAGKSTTAAAFTQIGYRILSEDVVALAEETDKFLVQPGYPLIRLWPSSVKALYGTEDALPLLTPNWDKRYLDLTQNGEHFQPSPLSLGAIYLLGERSEDDTAPFVRPLSGNQALMSLVANTYASRYMDKTMRAREFAFLSRLAARVPVRQVVPHADPAQLAKLCDVIINDMQGLHSLL